MKPAAANPAQGTAIRAYHPMDKAAVLDLFRLNTPLYFAPEEEQDLAFYLDREVEQYFVAENKGRIIGSGGINFSDEGTTGKISWDMVQPDWQGKGIGSLLLQHRLRLLKENPEVAQITVRTSQLAYRFYERNGFRLAEVQKDYWAPGFDLYSMIYLTA